MKRQRSHEPEDMQPQVTPAAHLNTMVLRKLQNAIAEDGEVDLISLIPQNYSARLLARKKRENDKFSRQAGEEPLESNEVSAIDESKQNTSEHRPEDGKFDKLIYSVGPIAVTYPLSKPIQDLLDLHSNGGEGSSSQSLASKLSGVIRAGEVIWRSEVNRVHAVVKCSSEIVLKIVTDIIDHAEYTSMQYLERNAPETPAPKALGLLTSGRTTYMFMSFIPGQTIDKIWNELSMDQKTKLRDRLNEVLIKLRAMKVPENVRFGGTCNEGCKDSRRHTRICRNSIQSCDEFQDFTFSSPHFGSSEYITHLRRLLRSHRSEIVFTHGDIRQENIVVQSDGNGDYLVSAIIDWEKSGFYPDYYECIKATNNMSPSEKEDWYLFLPSCAAPATYPVPWLVDRIWDVHVA